MAEIVKALAKTKAGMDVLKKQKLEIQYDLENNIMPQIRLYQNRQVLTLICLLVSP